MKPNVPPPLRNFTRDAVEALALTAAQELRDTCVVVSLLPWQGGTPPPLELLLPNSDEDELEFKLDPQQIETAIAARSTVLVPCAFEALEEEVAAHRIIPQLALLAECCILMVHIIPPNLTPSRTNNTVIMQRHRAMMNTGVDNVLFFFDPSPLAWRQAIRRSRSVWEQNARRVQLVFDAEPEPPTEEETQNLQNRHQHLLWENIPQAVMPRFPPLDRNLEETETAISEYRLVGRFVSREGVVLLATDPTQRFVAVKVIEKAKVRSPEELEFINREKVILTDMIQHVNIVRVLNMLHSPICLYIIFAHAGFNNLQQVLASQPSERLDVEESLHCFGQVVQGLAYCHSRNVCHRNLSLPHIVLERATASDRYHCTIVDFRYALLSKPPATSRIICGTLPCIAPEMALGQDYVPGFADCWSAGVLLLEMAGGLGSLRCSVPYGPARADLAQAAPLIQGFFGQAGSHGRALERAGAGAGAAPDPEVEALLEALLQPGPSDRARMQDILSAEGGDS